MRPRVIAWLEAGGALCLLVLTAIVLVDVAGRNLLNRPLPWGTEVLEVVLAAMIFLLYPVLARNGGHITVDLITVRPALQRTQRRVAAGIGAFVFAVIGICLVRQTMRSASYGDASALLGIPTAWVLGLMASLSFATVVAFVAAAVAAERGRLPPPHVVVD